MCTCTPFFGNKYDKYTCILYVHQLTCTLIRRETEYLLVIYMYMYINTLIHVHTYTFEISRAFFAAFFELLNLRE